MSNSINYANALMDLSIENNIDINQIVSQLQLVNSYFDNDFIKFLSSPKISKDNKKEVFKNSFKNLDKTVLSLLFVLIDNNKIISLNEIIEDLNMLIEQKEGIVRVEAYSTSILTNEEKNVINNYFKNKLNKNIKLFEIIDEKLVGGLVIKYQGKVIDGSLLTKHESLKEYLKK